ncbi:hypothetical protein D7V94_11980 [Parablautia intestinalis]|uniref:Uncharacterized protein n=1 Tax=Parablautia intestinalis TaxID=2320100 RepID=A0A3A9AHS8_9FIRM|nr:hypothetical protein [Lachnospiraceae bacterium]RKI90838.1 hypothetical protein D7V94_11980 [Parablautia intestinalis]
MFRLYVTNRLFHYIFAGKIFWAAKLINRPVDKYSAGIYGQNTGRKYFLCHHGWYTLGKRTALLCIILFFSNMEVRRKTRDGKKEEECE